MKGSKLLPHSYRFAAFLMLAIFALACEAPPTQPTVEMDVQQAKGGNGGGGGKGGGTSSGVVVNATDPSSAIQNISLSVRVLGEGFDETSEVTFLLDGKKTRDIITHSTRFLSGDEVVADISVAADAELSFYDVEVTASGGRKRGIGIELFEVEATLASLSGAMEGPTQGLEKVTESETFFEGESAGWFEENYFARVALTNTQQLVRSDPTACEFIFEDGFPEDQQDEGRSRLISMLVDDQGEMKRLTARFGKAEALSGVSSSEHFVLVETGPGVHLGVGRERGNEYYGFPRVTYSDGDPATDDPVSIDDPEATRIFTLQPADQSEGGPGTIRAHYRWEDPRRKNKTALAVMYCPLQAGDDIVVTVIPGSGK